SFTAQKIEHGKKRQSQYREVIAGYRLKQLNALFFQLVRADARYDRLASSRQIAVEKTIRKIPHRQSGRAAVLKQDRTAAKDRNRGVQGMGSAAEKPELNARRCGIRRFREDAVAQCKRLVSSQNQSIRVERRYRGRLCACQFHCDCPRVPNTRARLDLPLVDIGRRDFHRNAGPQQKIAPDFASRCEQEGLATRPKLHQETGWRRRSARSFMTAAAVSSIERRVTSMAGQLCFAQSCR